jgi:hypothetical protein
VFQNVISRAEQMSTPVIQQVQVLPPTSQSQADRFDHSHSEFRSSDLHLPVRCFCQCSNLASIVFISIRVLCWLLQTLSTSVSHDDQLRYSGMAAASGGGGRPFGLGLLHVGDSAESLRTSGLGTVVAWQQNSPVSFGFCINYNEYSVTGRPGGGLMLNLRSSGAGTNDFLRRSGLQLQVYLCTCPLFFFFLSITNERLASAFL